MAIEVISKPVIDVVSESLHVFKIATINSEEWLKGSDIVRSTAQVREVRSC
jgi:hypothetical protein